MKCVKCGNELQPGARFCVYCGTPVATEPEPAVETPVEPEPAVETAAPEAEAAAPQETAAPEAEAAAPQETAAPAVEAAVPPTYQQPVQQQYQQPVQQQPVYQQQYQQPVQQQPAYQQPVQQPAQKKSKKGLVAVIIVVIVLVAALAAAAVALVSVLKNKKTADGNNRQLSYVKDEKLYYVKDVSKESEPIVVSSVKDADDYTRSGLAGKFTADGSYLYFYDKVESSSTGRLCRVEVSKLKEDEDKNEELIEELVSGVYSYTLLDNDRFIYRDDSGKLYYYDGEDKNKIASDVSNFYIGEDGDVYFEAENDEDGYSYQLSRYSVADDETTKLIDNFSYIVDETEDGWFYDVYDTSDYLYDLYYASKDGDDQLIASDVYNIVGADAANSTVYYVTERTETICYYDYVNDIYAESDENITQPSGLDYLTACTEYDAMSDWDREYYTSYPDDIWYFYEWLYDDYNYGTGMQCNYVYREDENGNYTDEYYFYDEAADQWYQLDLDAYNAAYDAYYAVADRIYIRQDLQDETTDITYDDLNAWTPNGGLSVVASDISPYSVRLVDESGIVTYQKYGEIGKVDWPDDLYTNWFVSDYIYDCRYGDVKYFYSYNGTENEWDSTWGDLSDGMYFSTSQDGKYVVGYTYSYDEDYNDVFNISVYEVKDGTISLLEGNTTVTDIGFWQDNAYYYFMADSDGEGSLCCFADGKMTTVLKNISDAQVRRYDSGSYTAYADYDYNNGSTLKLFSEDGESTKIASEVKGYCYIEDDLIVYLSDEKLYVYRGEDEDKIKLDGSVTSFNCNGADYDTLNY